MSHGGNVWQGPDPKIWQDHSANLRPEGMPDWVRTALRDAIDHAEYYPEPTTKRAGEALSGYLGVEPERILVTAGGISALDLVTELGAKEIVLAAPCFTEYEELAVRHGIPVRRVSILKNRQLSIDEIMRSIRSGAEIRICNPINPIGAAFSRDEVLELAEACEKSGARLTVDEAFIDLCPENSVRDMVGKIGGLIVCGSLTKLLAIPGVRVGYVCADAQIVNELKRLRLTWEVSCFAEAVVCAMPAHAAEIDDYAKVNDQRRETLRTGLTEMGMTVYPSRANFLLADTHSDAAVIAEKLKAKHILVRECMDFVGINDGRHLRIAVRTEEENTRLIKALREAMACAENH